MYLYKVIEQLQSFKLVTLSEFLPCDRVEVSRLETQLANLLPEAYREFLLLMGHGAGDFLSGSDCFFQHLPHLQIWAKELLRENNFSEDLPKDAFVFYMHQGYQFSFFRLTEGGNPPTYSYCEGKEKISFVKTHNHYSDFLLAEVQIHSLNSRQKTSV
jgi:hypothetical protein